MEQILCKPGIPGCTVVKVRAIYHAIDEFTFAKVGVDVDAILMFVRSRKRERNDDSAKSGLSHATF
jgi:hypothetical protein